MNKSQWLGLFLVLQFFCSNFAFGAPLSHGMDSRSSFAASRTASPSSSTPGSINFNLGSSLKTANLNIVGASKSATLMLGGVMQTFTAGQAMTAAELVAASQVLSGGRQTLTLSAQGTAVAGGFSLSSALFKSIGNLVIPQNVKLFDNVGLVGNLSLSGNLTNAGKLIEFSTNPNVTSAIISANSIYNLSGATITTELPSRLTTAVSGLQLTLNALQDINNAGTIVSAGSLSLAAGTSIVNALPQGTTAAQPLIQAAGNVNLMSGSGNITNAGLIASTNKNINIAAQAMATDINVNSAGGTLQALNGNINLRDSSYNGPANINLTGGNYLSKQLNLYTGTGTATVNVGQLSGNLNTVAGSEHIFTDTSLLQLGNNISGDPTYYNTGGIEIVGVVSSTEDLAIIAGGDITANASGQIVTAGNNLLMIAGANITSTCTGCTSPGPGTVGPTSSGNTPTSGLAVGTVTVSLTGGTGGNIDLSNSTTATVIDTSSATSAGGTVTLVALADGLGAKGQVIFNSGSNLGEINTSGGGTGGGGNVTIYAGASSLLPITAINTNKVVTVSSGTSASGSVTLETTQAVTSDAQPLVLNAHGVITSGNTIIPGATLTLAGISTGSIDTHVNGGAQAAGNVTITAFADIDTSAGTILTINNGVGAAGEVTITSSNGSVSTGQIDAFVYSGWLAASNVTISAYGNITTNGNFIYAFQGGSGAGGTITLTSSNGSISTGILLTGVGDTVAAGNVIVLANGDITTDKIYAFNAGTGGGGTVTLSSSTGSVTTGEIDTNTLLGLAPAGNVTVSAFGNITIGGAINTSNAGISTGGAVTLLALGSLTTGNIKTSSTGSLGGAITAAAAGNNGSYSIEMGDLTTSATDAAGSVEIVSTDLSQKPNFIGTITAKASGQSGVGAAVAIATLGTLAVGTIDTTNTWASSNSSGQSGSVFLSSGSTAAGAILAGDINAYNPANGSASGQVILIASGTIGVLGTIMTSAGNSSVNPSYTSGTSSISSSTTINVSVAGISGPSSNYNPQGYFSMSGGSTQLTIDSGGNSSLLAPLLCLTTVSIDSVNANSGTNADGVALVAGGDITLGGIVGVNTAGTTGGGNVNLLSITGQISANGLVANSSGAGAAGSVSALASGAISFGGTINASNSGTGAGGMVTMISSRGSVSVGEIDTYVSGGSAAAGTVNISGFGDINTNSNAIKAFNAGTGSGGTVFLVSSNGLVSTGEIDTYVGGGSAQAGTVSIAAYDDVSTNNNAIAAYNGGTGASGIVMLISSNRSITTGAIATYVTSGSEKAADVTISAYGNINLTGELNAANTGSGSGSTVNLLSSNGSVTTAGIDVDVSTASIVAGNVNIEAFTAIDTSAGTIQATNGGTRPIDSGVTLLSHTKSVTTGAIDISVASGSALAGNVIISAPDFINVGAKIDASNKGTGSGGTVTLASSLNSVTVSEVDTYVKSSSQTAGSVSILASGSISANGVIDASNGGIGVGGVGTAGTVTLISNSDTVTTKGINTNVVGASAVAGGVTILANGTITANGAINTSNLGTGPAGDIALASATGSVSIGGILTNVSGGSASAGNVIISANGNITVTGLITTNNTGTGAGGSLALISSSTIRLSDINTSGSPSGSVFLSSGDAGARAIVTGPITLGGGALLATAATVGSIAVQSFTDGGRLSVDNGQIFATGTYASAVNILPLVFSNSAAATITPATIPGGGFTSFSNNGTVSLANDAGSSGNVITFNDLLPAFVQSSVTSLGTINDSTGRANFFVMSGNVSVSSATTYTSTVGSFSILANQMSLAAINTNGVGLSLTNVQGITTGTINTTNSGGTVAGNAKLLSVLGSVTTEAIDTHITSGSAPAGNVTISSYGAISTNQQAINTSNSGTGIGGTINLTALGAGSVETGQIDTSINNASSNAAAGNITIVAAAAIGTNQQTINASNGGIGAGGTLTLTSKTFSITTDAIDTHVASGSAPAGNVFISALQAIATGNINASNGGAGTGGSVTLVRAASMATADVDTSSSGSAGGAITVGAVGDNGLYTLAMGNLKTSGLTAAGSIMLVGDDFGTKPTLVGNITAQATGPSGIGGAVGISGLGSVAVGNIDTTNTAATTTSGAQSGSVFLSSGSSASGAILAGTVKAYNSANGSATRQVILIASGSIVTFGDIITSAGTIPANTYSSNFLSGTEASINPNYTSDQLSITASTTVNVSVTGISAPTSNYNPSGYAALSGSNTVLTINSGGNSLLLAPLVFTAYVPMAIKSINSNSHTAADGIALLVFGNLTLSDAVGINASGSTSGGLVTLQSSAGQISLTSIATNSSGAGAAGNINISAWAAIPVTGTINASNSGTGAGGTVFLASTDNAVSTGAIDTSVASGSAAAGNVTIATYGASNLGAINAANSGTGAGGTVLLTSSSSSVTTGQIKTGGSQAAGNVFISAYGAVNTSGNTIQTFNTVTGAGAVSLASTNNSIATGEIDTYVTGGSGAAGNVTITAYGSIIAGDIKASNSGQGTGGVVTLASSSGSITTGEINTNVEGGSGSSGNVSISAYGAINISDTIDTANAGTGTSGTVNLTSGNGSVSIEGINVTDYNGLAATNNVTISAYGNITTSDIAASNTGTGGGGTVNLTSNNGAISTGQIDTNTLLGLVPAGNVSMSAYGNITILGKIDASNAGTSTGGTITLLTLGSLTTGDIDTSSTGLSGGAITAAAAGNNGSYSIAMGSLNTSGSDAGGSVLVVSKNSMGTAIGTITTQASGQSGSGGSIGIATLGKLAVGNIDTTNTWASANSAGQSGSVFLSSGSTALGAILAGDIKAYNSANGSATGQVILIASGTIGVLGTITTSAGNSSVNPSYTSTTSSISSSTTVNVSVNGISGPSSNYNPQGYSSMSGGSTQLTIDAGGNSSLLAPLLCLGDVSIASIKSNSGTQADGVALAAFGNITLSGNVGINTVGTIGGGNANLLAVAGQISVVGIETESSGAGAAGNLSMATNGAITVGGTINASNTGTGAGGTVTLISSSSSVATGEIETGGPAQAGNVFISAFGAVSTNTIQTNDAGAGAGAGNGGAVSLMSTNNFVATSEIDTNVDSAPAAGNVTISAYEAITAGGAINASNAGQGSGTGGVVTLTSSTGSVSTGKIDTHIEGGSGKGGNVTISSYGAINIGDTVDTDNAGTGTSGTVNLTSSNGSVSTESLIATDYGGLVATSNVTISAYGAINTNKQPISTYNAGPGTGGTITLISSHGGVSTGLLFASVGNSMQAGNVIVSAAGDITTNLLPILVFNQGTGGAGTVNLTSSGGSITTGGISTYVGLSSVPAGNVAISAYGSITISGPPLEALAIDASSRGTSAGGNVTLLSRAGALTILGGIDTSSVGSIGGAIMAAAAGDNGLYSIAMGNLNTSGSAAGGPVLVVSKNSMGTAIGTITTQASGQSGSGGSVGIATLGAVEVGNIDTANTWASANSSGQSGSVFLSSGSTAIGAILAGDINAYNSANGSASGQVILIASGAIGVLGTITTSAGNSSVNQIYSSSTSSISSSTTVNVSVAGISGPSSNYNPQGYSSMSGSSTQLTINSGGNSSLLAPLLCLSDVSIASIKSNSGTQADGLALAAFGIITLSGNVGINTVGTTSGGNANLLAVAGQISVVGIETASSGAGAAGNVSIASGGAITAGGTIISSNSGTGAGGIVTLISNSSSVATGEIDTNVRNALSSAAAGNVSIAALGDINTNGNLIVAYNKGTGAGGTVTLTSSNSSVTTGEIDTNIPNALSSAVPGNVIITAFGAITSGGTINASNSGTGLGGIVTLTTSNGSATTGEIDTYFASSLLAAGYVTISAYGAITAGGAINASNAGTGTGSIVTLLSSASITTGEIDANVSSGSTVPASVYLYAYGAVNTSAGKIEATNGGTVTLASNTSSVTTGEIDTYASGGSTAAGAVTISAFGAITAGGTINASDSGTGAGGTVTLSSSTASVTTDEIDTYVISGSGAAGNVTISANAAINTNNNAIAAYNGGAGLGGTVFLISSNSSVATGGIDTNVSGGSAESGTVTILANGSITVGGAINASNAGLGLGGAVTLTANNGSVSIGGIRSDVGGGLAAAGNVIVFSSGAITVTGAIATDNTGAGAGGSVALISGSTIGLSTITTSGSPSGSVFLSSGYAGPQAIETGTITLAGGALLATAATSGSITVQSFADGGMLSVDNGHIYATGKYTSAVQILPQAFTNSTTATITPAIIPGGGFASFSNSGTVTLANDAGSSKNVIAFSDLVPVLVQGNVNSLGTINDSTGQANLLLSLCAYNE
jgi:hypothetical protein